MLAHQWYKTILLAAAGTLLIAGATGWMGPAEASDSESAAQGADVATADDPEEEVETLKGTDIAIPKYKPKTKPALRRELGTLRYQVTQEESTEPAFSNAYWNNKREGIYRCVVCGYPLFSSDTKFKSGTGWPSFYAPLDRTVVGTKRDWHLFIPRTEVHCVRCKAHLGHVFQDGPRPTGLRYCMNSASLKFDEADEASEATAKKSTSSRP